MSFFFRVFFFSFNVRCNSHYNYKICVNRNVILITNFSAPFIFLDITFDQVYILVRLYNQVEIFFPSFFLSKNRKIILKNLILHISPFYECLDEAHFFSLRILHFRRLLIYVYKSSCCVCLPIFYLYFISSFSVYFFYVAILKGFVFLSFLSF